MSRSPYFLVSVAIASGLIAALHMGKIPGALPAISDTFALSLTRSGLIVSSFSLVAACCGLAVGLLSGRIGMLRAGTLGLFLAAAGSFVGGFSTGYPLLLGSRVLEGLGFVLVAITMPGVIHTVCPPASRPVALGIWGAFIPAAMSLALIVSPFALSAVGWPGLWIGLAILSALWGILYLSVFRGAGLPAAAGAWPLHSLPSLFRGNPLQVVLIFICYSMGFAAFTAFLPTYWISRGLALELASNLAAAVVAGNIIGNICAGALIARGVHLRTLAMTAMVGGGLCASLVFSETLTAGWEFVAALGVTTLTGLLPGAVMASLAVIAGQRDKMPVLVGLVFQGAGVGQVAGPLLLGSAVTIAGGWHGAAALFIGISAVATLIALKLRL